MSVPKTTPYNCLEIEAWSPVLRDAAKEVFSMMAGMELAATEESVLVQTPEITAIVGLAGSLCGLLSVRCSNTVANKIASQMLGLGSEDAAQHRGDAIGEICNMVAGHFKAKIVGLDDKCLLSVPSVISGENYTFHSLSAGRRIEVFLQASEGPIWVALETRN
jgi:chemotaxis protein CheX